MVAMILAAGLGTRLKPWTLHHPKALVPVGGVPMLERVIKRLEDSGFNKIIVNVHHFSNQIIEFLNAHHYGVEIIVSDESDRLCDTGGGILKASEFFGEYPVLVHNVDILSNADLAGLMSQHMEKGNDVTLLTSDRESSRHLIFDKEDNLCGWHNLITDEYKPISASKLKDTIEEAFSGIYVIGCNAIEALKNYSQQKGGEVFPIMDFLLTLPVNVRIRKSHAGGLQLIDIGKPATLERASDMLF